MSRKRLVNLIDVTAFTGFVFMTVTGLVVRYVLPHGAGKPDLDHWIRGADRPVDVLWGLTRHEWADLHFWISLTFMAVLASHLLLHWRWIVSALRGRRGEGSGWRVALGLVGLLALLTAAAAPFLTPTDSVPRAEVSEGVGAGHPGRRQAE